MKSTIACLMIVSAFSVIIAENSSQEQDADPVAVAVKTYFDRKFDELKAVADKHPTSVDDFRTDMQPVEEGTKGFFGGTLIDTNFVISEVYFKRDFLARGFDLKKVKELDTFWAKMREKPEPQLSEPGHGNLFQPRLVAMRYPFLKDGKLEGIVSIMVRTEYFLEDTGLDKVKAFKIIVDDKITEEKGDLSDSAITVQIQLPSTEWVIKYDK